jgi:HPt (histidine-containing phosphotransfer) domain-containing protein
MNNKFYSLEKLKEIAQGDDAFVQEMITTFIDTASVEIKNVQRLMDVGDWKTIGEIAHKLATNYAYMGAESLYTLTDNIEKKIQNGCDLTEIPEMTRRMCADSLVLIDKLRKNNLINNDKYESVDL